MSDQETTRKVRLDDGAEWTVGIATSGAEARTATVERELTSRLPGEPPALASVVVRIMDTGPGGSRVEIDVPETGRPLSYQEVADIVAREVNSAATLLQR